MFEIVRDKLINYSGYIEDISKILDFLEESFYSDKDQCLCTLEYLSDLFKYVEYYKIAGGEVEYEEDDEDDIDPFFIEDLYEVNSETEEEEEETDDYGEYTEEYDSDELDSFFSTNNKGKNNESADSFDENEYEEDIDSEDETYDESEFDSLFNKSKDFNEFADISDGEDEQVIGDSDVVVEYEEEYDELEIEDSDLLVEEDEEYEEFGDIIIEEEEPEGDEPEEIGSFFDTINVLEKHKTEISGKKEGIKKDVAIDTSEFDTSVDFPDFELKAFGKPVIFEDRVADTMANVLQTMSNKISTYIKKGDKKGR